MKLNFFLPTEIKLGKDIVAENSSKIASFGNKAFIVTGRNSARLCGALDDLTNALDHENVAYEIFDKAIPNPTIDSVYEGANAARDFGADFIIAIGGGSPMDTAKAIAVLAADEIPRSKLFEAKITKTLPMIFIPTTAGTGSEVTQYSILTDDKAKTKRTISSPKLFPTLALLDPKYLEKVPERTTMNTALDALSHCVESYLSKRADKISELLALDGARAIIEGLKEGDHAKLQYGSLVGGIVIAQTATTAVHAMGYSLTYFKHIDHGRANGLLLYEYLRFEAKSSEKVNELMKGLGLTLEDFGELVVEALSNKFRMAEPVEEMSNTFTETELREYASIAIKAKNVANSLVVPDENDLFRILELSLGVK